MDNERRGVLKSLGVGLGATILAGSGGSARASGPQEDVPHWAMVVDLRLCVGCQACTVACSTENKTPPGNFRTIVSNYEVTTAGSSRRYILPRLCNHCERPACVTVCPTQATKKLANGVVVVDNTVCIGCAYCVQACPYEARFINSKTKTADKCTFCLHRIEAGLLPACVETCISGARIFGDLNDPTSEVSRIRATYPLQVLRQEMGTRPQVFYRGLDRAFAGKVDGIQVLAPAGQITHEGDA